MNRNGALYLNAGLLTLTLPALVRLIYEALYLRYCDGPQMLGFALFHGALGPVLGTAVILSLFSCFLFASVAAITSLLFLVPAFRRRFFGVREIPLMLLALVLFELLSEALQQDLPTSALLIAAAVFLGTFLFLVFALLATARLAITHQ
jgi:hypothetical protein